MRNPSSSHEARRQSYLYWLKARGIPYILKGPSEKRSTRKELLLVVSEKSLGNALAMEMLNKIMAALEVDLSTVEIRTLPAEVDETRPTIEFSLQKDMEIKLDGEKYFRVYDLMAMLEQPELKVPAWHILKTAKNVFKSYLRTQHPQH